MTHEVLSGIAGIGLYPTLSLCLFVALFAGMLWRVARMDSGHAAEMGGLPLSDGTPRDATAAATSPTETEGDPR
jgi:hypothetical protein